MSNTVLLLGTAHMRERLATPTLTILKTEAGFTALLWAVPSLTAKYIRMQTHAVTFLESQSCLTLARS